MNNLIKALITFVAILNLLIYPFQSYVQKELQEFDILFEQFYNYLVIAMFVGAAFVVADVWVSTTRNTGNKIIWSIVLLFPFPALSVPFYLWFIEPKNDEVENK
jgi:hypothetical protein